jgi:hypothetical protein
MDDAALIGPVAVELEDEVLEVHEKSIRKIAEPGRVELKLARLFRGCQETAAGYQGVVM